MTKTVTINNKKPRLLTIYTSAHEKLDLLPGANLKVDSNVLEHPSVKDKIAKGILVVSGAVEVRTEEAKGPAKVETPKADPSADGDEAKDEAKDDANEEDEGYSSFTAAELIAVIPEMFDIKELETLAQDARKTVAKAAAEQIAKIESEGASNE